MVGPWITFVIPEEDDLAGLLEIPKFPFVTNAVPTSIHNTFLGSNDAVAPVIHFHSGGAVAATPLSAHLESTVGTVAYQVPAGKRLVFALVLSASTSTANFKVRSSATVDTADGTVLFDNTGGTVLDNTPNISWTRPVLEVAASQFLTIERVSGTGTINIQMIIAAEKAA